MFVASLLLSVVAPAAARQFSPNEGELDVLSSVEVSDPVCMEGLYVHDGHLYQSNGWYGESALVKINAQTGTEMKRFNMASKFFGEGIATIDNLVYQLTYLHKTAFVYTERSDGFELVGNHTYTSAEGWGACVVVLWRACMQVILHIGSFVVVSIGGRWLCVRACACMCGSRRPHGQRQALDHERFDCNVAVSRPAHVSRPKALAGDRRRRRARDVD